VDLRIDAPAKVNLCLLVGPRRPDGYHNIFSVFAPVDLCDELEFRLTLGAPGSVAKPGGIELECAVVGETGDEDNLAVRALRAVETLSGCSIAGRVRITKRIPVGAGMGGGSSDAAAALRAAARLLEDEAGIRLESRQLHDAARSLGADVPFFLEGRPAIARGIGDRLEPIDIPPLALALLLPEEHLGTKEVYGKFDRLPAPEGGREFAERVGLAEAAWGRVVAGDGRRPDGGAGGDEASARSAQPAPARGEAPVATIAALLQNDLEAATFSLLPALAGRKRAIEEESALGALMSGSGPTLFGVCASPDHAADVARRLTARGYRSRAATACAAPTLP
jgi:4-diphosphocytidyl-2-C-methyl-D-erythritol kinase